MRPRIFDLLFHDDRMFVLEVSRSQVTDSRSGGRPRMAWSVVTRRNVPGYPPTRVDDFPTRAEAVVYYQKVAIETPRVSLGEKPPAPLPSLDEYRSWLVAEDLFDPILNPSGRRQGRG